MVIRGTRVRIDDNTGNRIGQIFGMKKNYKRGTIGDIMKIAIKEGKDKTQVKDLQIIGTKAPYNRKDGLKINFNHNRGIIMNEIKVNGMIMRELNLEGRKC